MENRLKILIIGSLPPPVGGTSVSLLHLVSRLEKHPKVSPKVINTSGTSNLSTIKLIKQYAFLIAKLLKEAKQHDVISIHVASSSLASLGIFGLFVSTFTRKPLVIRKFGGTDYNSYNIIKRNIIKFVLKKCNLYLAQTKHLVRVAQNNGINNVMWYPTSRPMQRLNDQSTHSQVCRKFIYLGQIKSSKGINEIIQAAERFDTDISVDVYGNLNFDITPDVFCGLKNVNYCGSVEPEKVLDVLRQYDAMVFPTYHFGEGYAGVILEAYSVGIPVIATRWQANPEIVNENTGILIEPKNVNDLYEAMKIISEDEILYRNLIQGVRKERMQYSSDLWVDYFISKCKELRRQY